MLQSKTLVNTRGHALSPAEDGAGTAGARTIPMRRIT